MLYSVYMINPLISVIVPVYNVEKYIRECIDSIIFQTYNNFELILVDDGTPDNSGHICDDYAKKDSRIKVIHKRNEGVSVARNIGIEVAKGEWITFVDSDDKLEEDALQICSDFIRNQSIDLLQFRDTDSNLNDRLIYEEIVPSKQYLRLEHPITVWGSMFKKSIINKWNLQFNSNIKIGEDLIFVTNYIKHCKQCLMLNRSLYFYRKNENGATFNMKKNEILKTLDAFSDLKSYTPEIEVRINNQLIELFCNKEVILNHRISKLRHLYQKLNIRETSNIISNSVKWFKLISYFNLTFALLIMKSYYKYIKIR